MFRKMLIAAVALVVLTAAPAAAQYDFSVSPTVVQAGGVVTVSGKGCPPNSPVGVKVTQRSTGKIVYKARSKTDANGQFTFQVRLRKNLAPGFYDLEARCALKPGIPTDYNRRALQGTIEGDYLVFRATIEIKGATKGNGVGNGTIVRTGSDLNGLGLVGAGLLTAGGLVLIASKRRRPAEA